MARFFGYLKGNRGDVTRLGSKDSGLRTIAAGWDGAIMVEVTCNPNGIDTYKVKMIPWGGANLLFPTESVLLSQGELRYRRDDE